MSDPLGKPCVVKISPPRKLLHNLCFGGGKIPGGQSASFESLSGYMFRPNRIVNKGDVDDLWICWLTFDGVSQLPRPVSLQSLCHGPGDGEITGATLQPYSVVVFRVENRGQDEHMFAVDIEGMALK